MASVKERKDYSLEMDETRDYLDAFLHMMVNTSSTMPYIGNHSRKKTFANFTDFGMIVNVFLLPFSIF